MRAKGGRHAAAPVRSILPGVSQIARSVWQEAAVETDQPAARVETGFSTPAPSMRFSAWKRAGWPRLFPTAR